MMINTKREADRMVFAIELQKDGLLAVDWCGDSTYEFLGRGTGDMQHITMKIIGDALATCLANESGNIDDVEKNIDRIKYHTMKSAKQIISGNGFGDGFKIMW